MRKISAWLNNPKNSCITFIAANGKAYRCDRVDFIGLKAVENFKKLQKELQTSQTELL